MVYYPPRSTSQRDYYNDYPPQTTQASSYSSSYLSPPSNPNSFTRDPQHDARRSYALQPRMPTQRSYSPLPRPPIGPIPTSRAPSPPRPRPPPRAQTYPSVNLHARGYSTPRHPASRKSQGNPEQENRERSARRKVLDEEIKRDEERKNKADEKWGEGEAKTQRKYDSRKEILDYRKRVERDHNRPVDGPEIRPNGAVDGRGFHRNADQEKSGKKVSWKGHTFRGNSHG